MLADLDRIAIASKRPSHVGLGAARRAAERTNAGQVFLLIDCSGSMSGGNLEQAKTGALEFSEKAYRQGYTVGLIAFDSYARLVLGSGRDRKALERAVGRLETGGSTNMSDALTLARSEFGDDRSAVRRSGSHDFGLQSHHVAVVVTDGYPDDRTKALKEASTLKEMGVRIITIGTDDADPSFLDELSTHKGLATTVRSDQLSLAIKSAAKLLPRTTGGQAGLPGNKPRRPSR
ncbi:MAG: VWA domain-containing protein [bacterium]|nr:VWA domain-containing protein [Acidimicrobiia bacterium]MCY4649718.1 VWA domain-containing protein [bacterium]